MEVTDDEEDVDEVDGAVAHSNEDCNPSAIEVDATNSRASGNASPRKVVSAVALSDVADQPQTAVPTNDEAANASGNASEQTRSPGLNNCSPSASRNNGIQAETEDEFHQQDRHSPDDDDDDDSDASGIGYDDYNDVPQEDRCSFDLTTLLILARH
jgi:hypothetical protein